MSSELQATSSSTSHHECEGSFGLIQAQQEVDSTEICNKCYSRSNVKGLEHLELYGGSTVDNCGQDLGHRKESVINSAANCQTSLIQTSQNQCYIVVQLNLPNSPELVPEEAKQRYILITIPSCCKMR